MWLLAWFPIGLWMGDPDFVLTRVSRGTFQRQLYQWLFYGGLLGVFAESWKRHAPPRPLWGRWKWFLFYFVQGLIASVVLRLVLIWLEAATWLSPSYQALQVAQILGGCLAVALVEEAVFRGFLLGHLVEKYGWKRGALLTSLLFAAVHLFRPGNLIFKLCYGIGLYLLGYLLAAIAWRHNSVLASAGFHAGVILLNLWLQLASFQESWLAGWNSEPVSGGVSIVLTGLFYVGWSRLMGEKNSKNTEPEG